MTKIATLKAQAKNLKLAMAEMGITLTQSQALEAIAKQYGVANWDTMSGILKKKLTPLQEPRLADMPCIPSDIWVEGVGPRSSKCPVNSYAYAALALLHDEQALRAYVEANPDEYQEGMDSLAIHLFDDGLDHEFTFNELLGIRYADVGMGNWILRDGQTYLRFCCDDLWRPEDSAPNASVDLAIPDRVKSVKGCQLLVLTSHDGAQYDRHAIVPPHLDAEEIAAKIAAELTRLKALDRLNEGELDYVEYTEGDVAKFVSALGCLWVSAHDQVVVNQTWD
jgi:hypothetical protein